MMRKPRRASAPTVATYRDDPLYPRIERAVRRILAKGKVVAPVDVLVDMGLLAPETLGDWRRGQVHYLEAVIHCNPTRLSLILNMLRFHAHDLKLVPSVTAYMRWGEGPKQRLRFTKTGDPDLEVAYAQARRHDRRTVTVSGLYGDSRRSDRPGNS
jgi:hypothetical protein